jgi:guanylate kinase
MMFSVVMSSSPVGGRGLMQLLHRGGVDAFSSVSPVVVSGFKATAAARRQHHTTTKRSSPPFGMVLADPTKRTVRSYQHPRNLEPLVVCGPSGVGKGTVIDSLMKHFASHPTDNANDCSSEPPFGFCVSHTTRKPRPGEIDGVHYFFSSTEDFQRDIQAGKFVEHAVVHGNYYGTSKAAIERLQRQERITILDIDMQGVIAVKESGIAAKYIFIAPPSLEELERRLRGRGTETEEAIQKRLGNAAKEISYGLEVGNFDHVIVNHHVDQTVEEMKKILQGWYPQLNARLP